MNICYVGFGFAPVENWAEILPMPKAPSNWKDPAKIQAHIEQKLVELGSGKAATEPLSGSIAAVHVLSVDDKGKPVKEFEHAGAHAGLEFYTWLRDKAPTRNLAGFKVHQAMRFMALDVISDLGTLPDDLAWAMDFRAALNDPDFRHSWQANCIDPLSVLFGSSGTDLAGACRRLNIEVPHDESASALALAALRMGKKLGLS